MIFPTSMAGKIAAVFFVIFLVALNPPVVTAVSSSTLFMGFAPLYLWFVCWGVFGSLILVWAAQENAFGLTENQVPPELNSAEKTSLDPDGDQNDSPVN